MVTLRLQQTRPSSIPTKMPGAGILSAIAWLPSLGSRDKPIQNADGSTYLCFGPKAPQGKGANWLATVERRGYFSILRLYGPTEAALNKGWKPGDIQKVT